MGSARIHAKVEPARGFAAVLHAGETLRITDIEGSQVSDLVAFSAADRAERFSPGNTRKLNNSVLLATGDVLYSNKCAPLLRLGKDLVGRHDVTSSWCSPYDYPIRFGIHDHPSCLGILTEVLEPYAIRETDIPEPFNVFMHTQVNGQTGEFTVHAPMSNAGDYLDLIAEQEVLIALTACPQDMNDCNGGAITPLEVMIK
ncbi:urea carboxylase-associated family protein [Pimelobacter simplex]|uniref:urea carboxylase-associated family protein n=1 Tax=Nocardioides simplex TaxID=2045 RepID=UPI00214F77D9|nr:urea carboxylase-associated family protein [Pimelobacter simplex]UUW92513.1 urea carboxylase-associated family protein [Pimelobacter simplex]UUW96341.1 urea carboxylase-associated family protein [Pimelobacter simplex]